MAEETPVKTPTYFPFKTFDTVTKGFLASGGVPAKLDRSVLSSMSGSGRSAFLVGLRFLGLVDDANRPTPPFEKFVMAEGDERKALLRSILTSSYSFLTDKGFDLARATGSQLSEVMTKEGATSSTREKAVAFFLKAAEEAGITVSPHILKRKHTPSQNPKPKQSKTKKGGKGSGADDTPDFDDEKLNALLKSAAQKMSDLDVLMKRIYDPSEMAQGSDEEKAVFTLARFLQLRELKKAAA